jgi:predicted ATPase
VDLIGRDAELSLVTDRLRDRRLVTLVGPGGIGKTVLAREAVRRSQGDFGEGSRVVDMTRVDSADAVRESLANQLGYTSFQALLDAPGDHSVLVLVDNCEHVAQAVADGIAALLDACQMPTVLATSRSALELPGETVVPVGPLTLPPVGVLEAPAVDLFVQRARDAGSDIEASEVVAELCRRLDGVPLAIELAAARTRAMAAAEILDRLAGGIDVLDRPRRRSARRHQSLRAAIGWSYDLLDHDERGLFERLSVFPGPFTAALAHEVAGESGTTVADTQDLLDRLVSASLVAADPAGDTTWYRELETLRAFARDRLDHSGERRAMEVRFVDHVVARVAAIIEHSAANWSETGLAELLTLYDNITATLRWCLRDDADPGRAFLLVAALWGVVHQAHTEEIGSLAEQVLDRWSDADDPRRADAVATAATCRYMLGDLDGGRVLAEAALATADASPYAPVTLRRAIAQACRASGDPETASTWFAAAAGEARRRGLGALAAEAEAARAQILADLGQVDEGLRLVAEARAEATAGGSEVAATWALCVEGSILLRSEVAQAVTVLEGALATGRRLGYAGATSAALRSLALAEVCRRDELAAARRVLELLDELLARGSTYELRMVFDVAAVVLARAGRRTVAADLTATALTLPVVSITASVGHELFPPDASGGHVLTSRDAIRTARAELAAIAAGTAEAAPSPIEAPSERVGVLRRNGDLWEIGYGGEQAAVRASKGLADIARLVAAPGREIHCLDLVGADVEERDTGEVLDAAARQAYEQRVRDLQADLEDAEAAHDRGRAEQTRAEMDAVVDELTSALGLGGRPRRRGGSAERARSTVTQRVRATIRHLDTVHPRLARHLRAAIRTGTFCAYEPEDPVRWRLET